MSPHSLSMSEKPIAEKPIAPAHDTGIHEAHPVDVVRILKAFGQQPKPKPPQHLAGTTSNLG